MKVMTNKDRIKRDFASGSDLSARMMVRKVKALTRDWSYDVVSLGYPGPVIRNRPAAVRKLLARATSRKIRTLSQSGTALSPSHPVCSIS